MSCVYDVGVLCVPWVLLSQRSSNAQPTLLQKLPGGVSVEAPKQNIAAGQAAVFAGLATWSILQVGWQQLQQLAPAAASSPLYHCMIRYLPSVWAPGRRHRVMCSVPQATGHACLPLLVCLLGLCWVVCCDAICHDAVCCVCSGAAGVS